MYPPSHLRLLLLLSGDVELNPGPITGKHTLNTTLINWYTTVGNPKDILRTHSSRLTDAISTNLYRVTDGLYAKGLISLDTMRDMYSGENESKKTGKLVIVLQTQLEASLTPDQYLIDICHVLINQQHQTLTDIATNILHQLGQYTLMSSTVYIARKFDGEFIVNFCNDMQTWLHVWCHIMLIVEKMAMFNKPCSDVAEGAWALTWLNNYNYSIGTNPPTDELHLSALAC